jgi:N-acetylglucosaminyldiphosphoundecaprenol N-acetyl-beta-D-mannosaminyltransferase
MKTEIFGVLFDNYTIHEAIKKAIDSLDNDKPFVIATPNPEIVETARKDEEYKNIINSSDIITPDGIGIVYASKILKGNIKERAAGFDIVCGIISELDKRNGSVFLFGSKPGVAEEAAKKLKEKYKNLKISGCRNGYFKDDSDIVKEIKDASPDLLLVCLGAPKQEKWIYANKAYLNAKILVGAGGTLDVLAGNVKRAPDIYIKLGLEWFYRLVKEPKRIGRMAKLPLFLLDVILKKGKDK